MVVRFVPLRVRRPWFSSAPAPATVLVVAVKAPLALTVMAPLIVRVREDSASVWMPELPPRVIMDPLKVVSRVTV